MQIKISSNVKNAIKDIFEYSFNNISSNYATKIVNRIYEVIYDLQFFPYIGRYVPELTGTTYRERICFEYRIIYFVSENENAVYIRYIFCAKHNVNMFFKVHKKELSDFFKSNY